jgi:hypothetical protein
MLSDADLAEMRAAQEETMVETCTIERKVKTSDGAGGFSEGAPTTTSCKCRIGTGLREPQARVIAEQVAPRQVYVVTLPALTDVQAEDRITVGGRTFKVISPQQGSFETARRCYCVEG